MSASISGRYPGDISKIKKVMAYNYETADHKNKRKIWCWFLLIIFLILACRAAYVTGNGAGQTRDDEVKEEQVKNEAIQDEMEKLC